MKNAEKISPILIRNLDYQSKVLFSVEHDQKVREKTNFIFSWKY